MTSAVSAPPHPGRPFDGRIALALLLALACAAGAWWSIPALTPQTFVAPPALSQNRLIELKANRVSTSRIVGLDVRGSSAGTGVRVVGGYMDAQQIVLFLRIDPPARIAVEGTSLRDQFGRSYAVTGQVADLATGESIVYFSAPGFPLLQTGARLTLVASALERAPAERMPASLSLTATVIASDPSVGAYVRDMAINYLVLSVAAAFYFALAVAVLWLMHVTPARRRAFLAGLSSALLLIVIALPTYIAIAFLIRHDPIGPGGLERQPEAFMVAAEVIVFYGIQAAAVVIGVMRAHQVAQARTTRLVPAAAVVTFLVLIQPLAEFANACYIGWGFLLRMSC